MNQDPIAAARALINRRTFLARSSTGIGTLALASLLDPKLLFAADRSLGQDRWKGVVDPLHVAPRAKRIIYLYMAGGPSHLETLDYKPTLAKMAGKPMPESITRGQPIAQLQGNKQLTCLEPQIEFKKYGKSGQELS